MTTAPSKDWYQPAPEAVAAHLREVQCRALLFGGVVSARSRGGRAQRHGGGGGTAAAGATVAAFVADATAESGRTGDVYAARVLDKWLPLDNPARPKRTRTAGARTLAVRLTADARRQLRSHDVPPDKRQYALYLPLHALWSQYATDALAGDTRCVSLGVHDACAHTGLSRPLGGSGRAGSAASLAVKVSKLDLHGAFLRGTGTHTHTHTRTHARTHARTFSLSVCEGVGRGWLLGPALSGVRRRWQWCGRGAPGTLGWRAWW
jgi:hypothetical protein